MCVHTYTFWTFHVHMGWGATPPTIPAPPTKHIHTHTYTCTPRPWFSLPSFPWLGLETLCRGEAKSLGNSLWLGLQRQLRLRDPWARRAAERLRAEEEIKLNQDRSSLGELTKDTPG